ncbi:restriction endonuclease subunit S [Cronobacter dublinensis]
MNLPIYGCYTKSNILWVGNYPSEWFITKVKYEAYVKARVGWHGLKSDDFTDEGPFLVTGSDFKSSRIQWADCYHCDLNRYEQDPYIQLRNGDLLITKDGTIGKVALVDGLKTNEKATLNSGVFVVRPLINNFSTRFYFWLLQSKVFTDFVDYNKTGSTIVHLYQDTFVNFSYASPQIKEQIQIAAFLDHETAKIDSLIDKQQQLIELLKEKRQAVISHAVTKGLNPDVPMKDSGVEWLGEVPEHWKICRIKQLSKQISKGTTPSTIGGDFVDEGIRFLKAENIGKSKFVNSLPEFYISNNVDKQISRSRLQERDVLVIIAGATTGMASVLQKEILPANTNQAVSFIRTKNINHADWIYYWLGTNIIQMIIGVGAVQAAQPNLSMEDLGNIPILLPEKDELASICMEIEKQFVQFESLICKAESAIDLMQERRTALISAAVTGKIDVRNWVAPDTQDVEEPQEATA